MGVHPSITHNTFPKQGRWVGVRARVHFHYGEEEILGTIIRDDHEDPHYTIIQLDDGRVVLASECQYSPFKEDGKIEPTVIIPQKEYTRLLTRSQKLRQLEINGVDNWEGYSLGIHEEDDEE